MRVLIHSTYPGTSARKALDLFLSPETPKRPADAKEIATFTYRDSAGVHVLFLYDVEDARLAAFLNAQNERSLYLPAARSGGPARSRSGAGARWRASAPT